MNADALEYLAQCSAHIHKLYEMVESRTVRMKDNKEEYFKFVPGSLDVSGEFKPQTRAEVKDAIDRFLKEHEKSGIAAATQLQTDLTAAHKAAGMTTGFARKSRETHPGLVFRTHVRYLMDYAGGHPKFDLNKALLVDLPETYKDICRDLSRAL